MISDSYLDWFESLSSNASGLFSNEFNLFQNFDIEDNIKALQVIEKDPSNEFSDFLRAHLTILDEFHKDASDLSRNQELIAEIQSKAETVAQITDFAERREMANEITGLQRKIEQIEEGIDLLEKANVLVIEQLIILRCFKNTNASTALVKYEPSNRFSDSIDELHNEINGIANRIEMGGSENVDKDYVKALTIFGLIDDKLPIEENRISEVSNQISEVNSRLSANGGLLEESEAEELNNFLHGKHPTCSSNQYIRNYQKILQQRLIEFHKKKNS